MAREPVKVQISHAIQPLMIFTFLRKRSIKNQEQVKLN